jgi:hypothetical protein
LVDNRLTAGEVKTMNISKRSALLVASVMAVCAALVGAACDSPVAPDAQVKDPVQAQSPESAPAVQSAAVVAVEAFTLVRDPLWGAVAPLLRLDETGGRSDAIVDGLAFNLVDLATGEYPIWRGAWRVPAAGAATIGDGRSFVLEVPGEYRGRVSVLISFTDDRGNRGTTTAVTDMPK